MPLRPGTQMMREGWLLIREVRVAPDAHAGGEACQNRDAVSFHERLTALDASFLGIETETSHMHVGGMLVFDAGPLGNAAGGIDARRIRKYLLSILDRMPRYRQRLEWVPGLRHPVWVDDIDFNIHYHLRHTALPRPGDDRLLKRLAGRIFSQRLDRTRPMWELWIVEGLEGNRFAMIPKVHHCMIDGIAGVDLMSVLLRGTTDETIPKAKQWLPRPSPPRRAMLIAELEHRARGSRDALERTRDAMRDMKSWWRDARETAEGIASTLTQGLVPASPTPLNPKRISPHRRFDTFALDLSEVKKVKNRFGVTVNDVVLATATGALARFLERRGLNVSSLADFRALVPVNVRRGADHSGAGNRVALLLAQLPIAERDPVVRLHQINDTTRYLKTESKQAESAQLIEEISDFTSSTLVTNSLRLANRQRSYNVVITNVPGPPFPLYLLGARLRELYPLVPLFQNQALGFALFSYAGTLYWGLNSDWHQLPDLHDLLADLRTAFDELTAVAKAARSA